MRRRLYFIFPSVNEANLVHNELLLARLEERHMHVLARDDINLGSLPEASIFEKSDLIHGLQLGLIVGGGTGILLSTLALSMEMIVPGWEVLSMGAVIFGGALFGAWSSSMIAVSAQNTRLKAFMKDINAGRILYMVDVPVHRVEEISQLVHTHHPNVDLVGIEPTIPAFP